MKKNSMMKRILSGILVLIMLISMCPTTVFATNGDFGQGQNGFGDNKLSFTKVEGIDADVKHPATKVEQEKEEPVYDDADIVRVSIVLSKASTLERFSTTNIASNNAAMAYRQGLQVEQETVVQRIEKEALAGAELDVVWNLTLAANIISVNVAYGLIDEIAAVRGVEEVFLETRYEHSETVASTANPMMATSTQMTGAAAAWAAGYTGAGSRIAVIDTGLDLNHQSFNNNAFLYSLQQNAAEKGMNYETYLDSLDLMTKEDIANVLPSLNIYPFIEHSSGVKNGNYYYNDKVPFRINYVDRDFDVTHDNDTQGGHGSHVAGIADANRSIRTGVKYVNALQ